MTKSFVTIGFTQRGRSLVADQPRLSKTAEIAVELARRLSETGAVAFEQSHDAESECYDDPIVLFKSGNLPSDFLASNGRWLKSAIAALGYPEVLCAH